MGITSGTQDHVAKRRTAAQQTRANRTNTNPARRMNSPAKKTGRSISASTRKTKKY
jgi:hypothetical protein